MSNLMYAQMGLDVLGGVTSFASAREEGKLQRAIQDYNNTISALSAAQANNVTTLNEIQAQDAAQRTALEIQKQAMTAEGAARVSAGAAGVSGGAVESVMRGLRSSVSRAHYGTMQQLQAQYRSFGQERRNTAMQAVLNKDVSVIPRPSGTSALLGISKTMLSTWDKHQPAGERLADQLSRI